MPWSPKVRVRLVSLQAAEHCCVSHCLFSVSCVHHTMMTITIPGHSKGPWWTMTTGPGQVGRNHPKCKQALSKNSVWGVGHSHIFIL